MHNWIEQPLFAPLFVGFINQIRSVKAQLIRNCSRAYKRKDEDNPNLKPEILKKRQLLEKYFIDRDHGTYSNLNQAWVGIKIENRRFEARFPSIDILKKRTKALKVYRNQILNATCVQKM
jgi:hypothetical protein